MRLRIVIQTHDFPAEPAVPRLPNAQRERNGDERIDGIATMLHRVEPKLRRIRMPGDDEHAIGLDHFIGAAFAAKKERGDSQQS